MPMICLHATNTTSTPHLGSKNNGGILEQQPVLGPVVVERPEVVG